MIILITVFIMLTKEPGKVIKNMKIAFWSPVHGQTGTTSNMIAIATVAVIQHDVKALLVQTHFCLNNLERSLIGYQRDKDSLIDIGVDELARSPKLVNLDRETIYNCSVNAFNNLHLLPGTLREHREDYEKSTGTKLTRIITAAEKYYDIVFVDTNAGNSKITMDILNAADLIVVNLSQNVFVIDKYLEDYKLDPKKTFYLIGDYEKDSRYNLFNLKSKYEIFKKNTGVIPHSVLYKDAHSSENALRFIRANIDCKKGPNAYFIKSIKDAAEKILDAVKKVV